MSRERLTPEQCLALELLAEVGFRQSPFDGVMTAGASRNYSGEAWINWRTAYALRRRGLVRVDSHGEGGDLYLTEQGRDTAARLLERRGDRARWLLR